MITLKNVRKKFGRKDPFWALNGVDLEIEDGEFIAVCGKSGSGKSTLLNMIGALDAPTEGEITVDGEDLLSLPPDKLAEFRNKKLGFVFQSFYLEPGYTVADNVELPLILAGVGKRERKARVAKALEAVGLTDKAKNKAADLSGGEQQRTAIARATINDPKYILADEPCGNLDTANSEMIMRLLTSLHEGGKTVIMVTHDPEDAAKAERIVTMSDGKIVKDSASASLRVG